MGKRALLVDVGSTYTKAVAVDLEEGRLLGRALSPTTVSTDVTEGVGRAVEEVKRISGVRDFEIKLASSSAAGGLRMVAVGYVRELTAEAARLAALGAGAKVLKVYAYGLSEKDVEEIEALSPEIVLLSGGTDGGDEKVVKHNARMLAKTRKDFPVVFAGNRLAGPEVKSILERSGKEVIVTENVMPSFGKLNIGPAREAIRELFLKRIVRAKGLDKLKGLVDEVVMPTPAAVLEAVKLLADGPNGTGGLGDLVAVDPGGATTDVYSVCEGKPTLPGVVMKGLVEPRVKRTVEGDLGIRVAARSLLEAVGEERLLEGVNLGRLSIASYVEKVSKDTSYVPSGGEEVEADLALIKGAIWEAVRRHAGYLEEMIAPFGVVYVQYGKDLSEVKTVVGTGGFLSLRERNLVRRALMGAVKSPADGFSLKPKNPRLFRDRGYVLFAVGLLARRFPEQAFRLGTGSLEEV